MSNDSIFIEKLALACHVGHTRAERSYPQIIELDVQIFTSLANAGASDKMKDTVDYARVILDIKRILKSRRFVLIETVAETVAASILRYPAALKVSVRAAKRVFPDTNAVGVIIHRQR